MMNGVAYRAGEPKTDPDARRLRLARQRWAAGFRSRVAAMSAVVSLEPEQDPPTPQTDDDE